MSSNHGQALSKLPLVCILSGVALTLVALSGVGAFLPSFKKKPKLKLVYFDIKGKAECIRMLCSYANYPLEDYRFKSREEFSALKGSNTLTYGQVPALYVNDGETILCQTSAIMRYLGKLTGLYPSCPKTAAVVDGLLDFENDLLMGLSVSRYADRFGYSLLTPENIVTIRTELNEKVLPSHLANLERLLMKSKTGYAANTGIILIHYTEFIT